MESTWKESNKKLQENLKERYGVDSLDIPMFSLLQFNYCNKENIQNKKMRAISKFEEKDIIIENKDHLSGYFDGNRMHCFYRTIIPSEYSYDFENILKRYNILYEKIKHTENIFYSCDIAKIEMENVKDISSYPQNIKSLQEKIKKSISKKLIKRII